MSTFLLNVLNAFSNNPSSTDTLRPKGLTFVFFINLTPHSFVLVNLVADAGIEPTTAAYETAEIPFL